MKKPMTAKCAELCSELVRYADIPKPWAVQYLKALQWYTGGAWLPSLDKPVALDFHRRLYKRLDRAHETPLHLVFWLACRTQQGVAELRTYNRMLYKGGPLDLFMEWVRQGGENLEIRFAREDFRMYVAGLNSQCFSAPCEAKISQGEELSDHDIVMAANELIGLPGLRKLFPKTANLLEQEGVEWL